MRDKSRLLCKLGTGFGRRDTIIPSRREFYLGTERAG